MLEKIKDSETNESVTDESIIVETTVVDTTDVNITDVGSSLESVIQEIVTNEGCILYDYEFTGSGGARTLRIFVDNEAGIGIDECTQISRALNLRLDTDESLVPGGAYHLEVSSPGLERSLKKKWHFEKAIGEKINFRLSQPLGSLGVEEKRWQNCKHTDGVVLSVLDETVELELSGETKVRVPLNIFEKAKIVFDFSKPKNKR